MRYAAAAVMILIIGSGAGLAVEYTPLTITSPRPNEDLSSARQITIRWETTLGGDVDYNVVYSSDGKTYDRIIALKLRDTYECVWEPKDCTDLSGWIKVKAYRNGYLLAESVVQVGFIPATAIVVSKADQRVLYFSDGKLKDVFVCSTALPEYDLEPGTYRVYSRQLKHWSDEYEVWMPHSLFFHRGYALHATSMIRQLGRPASHGCVRLHPKDAKKLYEQVTIGTPVIVLPRSRDCSSFIAQWKSQQPNEDRAAAR